MKPLTKSVQPRTNLPATNGQAPKIKRISLSEIEHNAARQPRVKMNPEHVESMQEFLTEGGVLPAIRVYSETGNAPFYLSDGWHRIKSNVACGFADIDAEIMHGGALEAFDDSLGANFDHGLPLTNADKNRKIKLALEKHPDWSNSLLAERCRVSAPFVLSVRAQLVTVTSSNGDSSPETTKRLGKDGKKRSAPKPKPAPSPAPAQTKSTSEAVGPSSEEIPTLDGAELPIPANLLPEWNAGIEQAETLKKYASALRVALRKPEPLYAEISSEIKDMADDIFAAIKLITPHALCPKCLGAKCAVCRKRGFVSKMFYDQFGKK